MNLPDVSFVIFTFMPQGWIFMISVIIIECLAMTRLILPGWFDRKIYIATTLTNFISERWE